VFLTHGISSVSSRRFARTLCIFPQSLLGALVRANQTALPGDTHAGHVPLSLHNLQFHIHGPRTSRSLIIVAFIRPCHFVMLRNNTMIHNYSFIMVLGLT